MRKPLAHRIIDPRSFRKSCSIADSTTSSTLVSIAGCRSFTSTTCIVFARRAAAEMHLSLGAAVFFNRTDVTLFGLIYVPLFYTSCQRF